MNDFDRYLSDRLSTHAARARVPAGDLQAVLSRGRRRRRRQHSVAVLAAASVVGGVGVAVTVGGGSHPVQQVSVGADVPSSTTVAASTLNWQVESPGAGNGLGYVDSLDGVASAGGTLYALSTAPGQTSVTGPVPRVLYQSSNGIDWQTASAPQGLTLSELATEGDEVYAVGTGTAVASVGAQSGGSELYTVGVASSSGGSGPWTTATLPIDFGAIGQVATTDGAEAAHVAAGPKGTVVAVSLDATLDLSKLTALTQAQQDAPAWAVGPQGLTLLDAACPTSPPADTGSAADPDEACYDQASSGGDWAYVPSGALASVTEASLTWSQLGIGGDALRAVLDEPFLFSSTDGTHFSAVPAAPTAPALYVNQVVAGPDGFALVGEPGATGQQIAVWSSPDGDTWTATPAPLPGLASGQAPTLVQAAGYVDGQLTLVSTDGYFGPASGITVATLEGGNWANQVIPGSDGWSPAIATIGPLGVVVTGTKVPSTSLEPNEAAAQALAAQAAKAKAAVAAQSEGTGGTFASPATTVAPQETTTAPPGTAPAQPESTTATATPGTAPATPGTTPPSAPTSPDYQLWYSGDGVSWSTEDLASLSGGPVGNVESVAVNTNQVLVTVERAGSTAEVTLVGSPT